MHFFHTFTVPLTSIKSTPFILTPQQLAQLTQSGILKVAPASTTRVLAAQPQPIVIKSEPAISPMTTGLTTVQPMTSQATVQPMTSQATYSVITSHSNSDVSTNHHNANNKGLGFLNLTSWDVTSFYMQ